MNDSRRNRAVMGGGDEISELRRLLPPPAAPELTAGRSQALRAHLAAEVARERHGAAPAPGYAPSRQQAAQWQPAQWRPAPAGSGRRRNWLVAGLTSAVAVGAAAAVAVTVWMPGNSGGAGPGGAGPGTGISAGSKSTAPGDALTAVTLLAKIADAAARQPQPKVSNSEFVYVRSEVSWGTPLHERQVWMSVASLCNPPGLLIEHGKRISLGNQDAASQPTTPGFCGGGVNDPTYRFLQKLPTDPQALLSFIYHQIRGERWGSELAGEEFTTIGDMIRESIVPPKTAAGLFRAAALIPGVRLVGHVTNAVGRPGIGVSFKGHGDLAASEWIFDPVTYQFIGERGGNNSQTAILQQAFVAHAGQFPKR
jgi:hypothetical protein